MKLEEIRRSAHTFPNHAYACILAGYLGDAVGAYVELNPIFVEGQELRAALDLEEGGSHQIGAGQVTDDSEMSMSLMWALILTNYGVDSEDEKHINFDTIAQLYVKWLRSKPFDIDSTVNYALNYFEFNSEEAT